MGACYSNKARQPQATDPPVHRRPSSTSLQSDSGALSFLKPYDTEADALDMDRSALHTTAPPYSKSRPSTHRGFGFRAPSSRAAFLRAPTKLSSSNDSIGSSSSDLKAKTGSNASLGPEIKSSSTAYAPKDQKHWRMIDDESRSVSVKSGESTNNRVKSMQSALNEDDIMNANVGETSDNNNQSGLSQSKASVASSTKSSGLPVSSKLPHPFKGSKLSGPRGPLAKFADSHYGTGRGWIKASTAESTESSGKPAQVGKSKAKSISQEMVSSKSVQSQLDNQSKDSSSKVGKKVAESQSSSQSKSKEKSAISEKDADDKKDSVSAVDSKSKKAGFLRRGFFKKSKSVPNNNEDSKEVKDPEEAMAVRYPGDEVDSRKPPPEDEVFRAEENREIVEEINSASLADLNSMAPSIAPMASLDCLETASLGSIGSDDLMLDMDIGLEECEYEEKDNVKSRSRSNSYKVRSRSRSQSQEDPEERSSALSRQDSVKKVSIGNVHKESAIVEEGPCEALDELASLLDNNPILRRNPRLGKANRPCSFPGPRQTRQRSMDEEHPLSMRPPRETPSFGDEEIVTMDGFTYRQLLQDIRTYKTMLLKLKRIIQQEEIGTPWKNGLMFPGSQPTSPMQEEVYRPLVGESPTTDKDKLEDLMKENLELKEQNQALNQQRDEQERTIKLLQHQMETTNGHRFGWTANMTKYECGHLGPKGKAFTNATVQTERPPTRLSHPESRDKSAAASKTDPKGKTTADAPAAGMPRCRNELRRNTQNGSDSKLKGTKDDHPTKDPIPRRDSLSEKNGHDIKSKVQLYEEFQERSTKCDNIPLKKTKASPWSQDFTQLTFDLDIDSLDSADENADAVIPEEKPVSRLPRSATASSSGPTRPSKLPALRIQRYTRTEAHQLRSFSGVAKPTASK